ncbi:hypothetical protein Y032_0012g1857 [Ancylostoma ceylanicum]|uniref:Uncharacterized protein n=1 Tax=Ancylostoma ceylanicum TaxID=53326 RepID=A0A016VEB6_9BILA|nr:hypothetical protein Y032_0012g1857 [Ancylostoma ceylanicum]
MDSIGFVPARETRATLMYLICLLVSLASLLVYCPECYAFEVSFETLVLPNAVLVILLAELFIICGLYGTRRFFSNVSTMTMGKVSSRRTDVEGIDKFINVATLLLWKAVIPVALLVCSYNILPLIEWWVSW